MARARKDLARGPTLDEVRAFVHLARDLHFGRAAGNLGIGRSSLSERIRRLEEKLGTVLFERTSRSVALTRAGADLLPRARIVASGVEGLQAGPEAASRRIVSSLTVGIEANGFGDLTAPILAGFRAIHPGVELALREFDGVGQTFFDKHLDAAMVRSPLADDRLDILEVAVEPRGLLVSLGHPRAESEGGSIDDFLDDPFLAVPPHHGYWMAEEYRGGDRPRIGGEAFTLQEVLHAVAHLGLITTAGRSITRWYPFPGVAFADVDDLSPVVLSLAVRTREARPMILDFVDIVREVAFRALDTSLDVVSIFRHRQEVLAKRA